MSQPSPQLKWAVWGGLGLMTLLIVAAFIATQLKAAPDLPVYGNLPAFTLTNQLGKTVTLGDLSGKVWIADAIFTRCPGQCLEMSAHMKQIQDALPSGGPIQLVSFTTDPAYDSPRVLKKYGEHFGAHDDDWSFLTGPKRALNQVEINGLRLSVLDKAASERTSPDDLFIHSEKFVLLDKQGRIRGYYDGQEAAAVAQVLKAAKALSNE